MKIAAVLFALLLIGGTQANPGTIEGTVTDWSSSAPVVNARVAVCARWAESVYLVE